MKLDNPTPYIQLFIIIQSILFLLYLSMENRLAVLANKLLGCLMLVLCLQMSMNLFGRYFQLGAAGDIAVTLGFLYGPILYFYSRSLTYQQFAVEPLDSAHLIPAIASILLTSITSLNTYVFAVGIFLSLTSYSLMTWFHLKRYRYILSQTRSEFDQIALTWLSNLLLLQLGLLIVNIISVSLFVNGYSSAGSIMELLLFCGLWLLVSMMIFQGMQHPLMFSGVTEEDRKVAMAPNDGTVLTEHELQEIMQKIDTHLTKKKVYLNSGLTVKSLGRQLVIVPKLISQTINQHRHKNFSEYVNSYRIKHACELLTSDQSESISIMDVMLESGFITKSNFNRAFKAETGMTPLQFKKSTKS